MKIILIMVSSLDGKITKGGEPNIHEWTSIEDQKYFADQIAGHNLIVMGRKTFEVANPKPQAGKLRVIVTSKPEKYQSIQVDGQLEFTNEHPNELVAKFEKSYKTLLLVGGGSLNTAFLQENMVDELWLTIEPVILGEGKMIVEEKSLNKKLHLFESRKLNEKGTMLLKYKIEKN